METAAAQANVPAGTQEEATVTIEAQEDRDVHFVSLEVQQADSAVEVSFSAAQLLVGETVDETASGVLAVHGRHGSSMSKIFRYDSAPIRWDAGEEINLHVNNFSASENQVRLTIGYVPMDIPSREQLRR